MRLSGRPSIATVRVAVAKRGVAPPNPTSSRHGAARSNGKNRTSTARVVAGLFFPQSKSLGTDRSQHSPGIQKKIVYAGTNNTSYEQAQLDLHELAEIHVDDKQIRRICKQIGTERCEERDAAAADYQALPLVERKGVPEGAMAPDLAVVGVDGGRLQIFDRSVTASDSTTGVQTPPVDAAVPTSNDTEEREDNGRHWREDKIGLLMTMKSEVHASDPCPEIPENFVNPLRILKLARELKKKAPPEQEAAKAATDPEVDRQSFTESATEWQPPEVQEKRMTATRRPWESFGPLLATAAWAWGFFEAKRRAFIGDGAENNWTLWRNHFSSFEPILDFIHALSYVFAAATAGRPFKEGWDCYVRWITWVWQGKVENVLAELEVRQIEVGMPNKDTPVSSPSQIVDRARTYLQNNRERMKYAEYRKQGLPITSSYVESAVKQFNYRVKGTEKFWDEQGAEEMLQLRGDFLSDNEPLEEFWKRRENKETGQRRYRKAA
jgi:hypothetical protein